MAEPKKYDTISNKLNDYDSKTSILSYGMDNQLEKEDGSIKNIIKQTIVQSKKKYGIRTNGKPIRYFNEINLGSTWSQLMTDAKNEKAKKELEKNPEKAFKTYMSEDIVDVSGLMAENSTRSLLMNNYRIIRDHITECSQALDVYKNNIMSPDDFTKSIFNVKYDDPSDDKMKEKVESQLEDIFSKYELEDKTNKIIEDALLYGEAYVGVLSLETELNNMLSDPKMQDLNESELVEKMNLIDTSCINSKILSEDVNCNEGQASILNEILNINENGLSEADAKNIIANMINENVKIGSKNELLLEKIAIEKDFENYKIHDTDINNNDDSVKKTKKKKNDNKPMYLNGSFIQIFDPKKVIDLTVGGTCYGYYVIEGCDNELINQSYLGQSSGRQVTNQINMASNNTIASTNQTTTISGNVPGINDNQKVRIITDVFVNTIAKKIDKEFIRHNKKFKDFIYDLVKQDYITKKGIKITYFLPNEIIAFKVPALYRKILFSAKLYLSVLTNDILVKLGRAHDKRLIYVNIGLDENYEQAISKVLQDIKTKEYKMDSLNDFQTILNLNPGRWDDYIMPSVNGDRPVEIETMPGMDTDLNSEFLDYLKNTMINGIGIPRNLIDSFNEIDFARTLSAQNGNFARDIVAYQKLLTTPFTILCRNLYKNEFRYNNDKESNVDKFVNMEYIKVSFPSPAYLNFTNLADQIQTVDGNAEFIATQMIPPTTDASKEDERVQLKSMIVKDMLPGIDWDKYEEFKKQLGIDNVKKELKEPKPDATMVDPYGGTY